ncbi:acylneuraminate cytidylyltransferase family protein [Shewanella woodyi]|uniref:acylneuraminate cytidylyltransferase family protein n=1 Tax=Shewanella woodyi TaxID=60961 RepID=UPI0007EBD4FD|nr:acylneuraminate cytidylyltransferase family protein [Shewanella woodyi]
MDRSRRVVALIPARAGSKRLKNKNLLPLAGKPLIAWTIEAALDSPEIDEVVVSTDSTDIKQVAIDSGATVPFMRPKCLAHDTASTDEVLMHAIDELKLTPSDIIVLLQPTSPLRDKEDIGAALYQLNDENVKGVVSVCECEHSPMWSNTLPENLCMGNFIKPEIATKRSQDLPCYYRLNGAIFAYKVSYLNKYKSRYYSNEVKAIVTPVNKSVDIDNKSDFQFAEFLMTNISSVGG